MGGLLTLPSFVKVFPQIDTTQAGTANLTTSQKNHRSTIQGEQDCHQCPGPVKAHS